MRKYQDVFVAVFSLLATLLIIAGSAWVWTSAPCGLWTFAKTGDVPARCLMHR